VALTVTSRGTGTHNTGATTLVPDGRSATLAVGSMGVLCIALDNAGASGASLIAPTSWTDAKGNVWTRRVNALYDNGAASAGIEMAFYTAPITVALLTTDAGTMTWIGGVSPVAKAWTWYEVIPSGSNTVDYNTGGSIAGATAANAQVTTASVAIGDAVIAGYFSENVAAVTGDSDTTNGTWTAQQTATVGTTTSGVRIATQQKVQTTAASTQSYDVTVASQDRIAGYIMLSEHVQLLKTDSGTGSDSGAAVKESKTASDSGTGSDVSASLAAQIAPLGGLIRGSQIVADDFSGTNASAWPNADTGGAYTADWAEVTTAAYSEGSGVGKMTTADGADSPSEKLGAISTADVDLEIEVTSFPNADFTEARLVYRRVDVGDKHYQLIIQQNGNMYGWLERVSGGTVAWSGSVIDLGAAPISAFHIRAAVVGTSHMWKFWTTTEPGAWTQEVTESNHNAAGSVGVIAHLITPGHAVWWDNFNVYNATLGTGGESGVGTDGNAVKTEGANTTPSGADSGVGSDTSTALTAALTSSAESGAGTDASVRIGLTGTAEQGVAADVSTALTAVTPVSTEAGTGADASVRVGLVGSPDQGTGTDTALVTVPVVGVDSGAATDAVVRVGLTGTAEAGAATDASTALTAVTPVSTESGAGTDASVRIAPLASAESGVATDASTALTAALPVSTEAGTATDASVNVAAVTPILTESGTGTDTAVSIGLATTDSAAGVDDNAVVDQGGSGAKSAVDSGANLDPGYSSLVLEDAPSMYLRLGEPSGTFVDSSGSGLTVTESGTLTRDQANALVNDDDGAVAFPTISDYLTVGDDAALDIGNTFSIEFWARFSAGGSFRGVINKGTGAYLVFVDWLYDFPTMFLSKLGSADIVSSSWEVPFDDTWHHYVITRNGVGAANALIYKDGVEGHVVEASNTSLVDSADGLVIGRFSAILGALNGALDELAIYKATVLTPERIAQHVRQSPARVTMVEAKSTTEAGQGSDAVVGIGLVGTAEQGVATDGALVTVPVVAADSGTATDASVRVGLAGTAEQGAATDTAALAAAYASTEAGTGADAAGIGLLTTEAGVATDTQTALTAGYVSTESGVGSDAATVDSGGAKAGFDDGVATDAVVALTVILPTSTDSGVATDGNALVIVPVFASDGGTATDTAVVTALYASSDSGVGTELAALTAGYLATDSGVATDGPAGGIGLAAVDSGVATDASVSVIAIYVTSDGAQGSDTAVLTRPAMLTGYTRDRNGAILPNCIVKVFRTSDDAYLGQTTSSGTGHYQFDVALGIDHYLVAYLDGSPDAAGTTVNTLQGS